MKKAGLIRDFMQVSKVNTSFDAGKKAESRNIKSAAQPFKGIIDSISLGTANAIENGGLAVSFTLQDMLGTNFPRPIMGLLRNQKENHGKKNKSFAAKEFVREFLTGPSMFIIPGAMLKICKDVFKFGNLCDVPVKYIRELSRIHAENAVKDGKIADRFEFFKDSFAQIVKNAKGETEISKDTVKTAEKYAKILENAMPEYYNIKNSGKLFAGWRADRFLESKAKVLLSRFEKVSKAYSDDAVHADFTAVKISDKAAGSMKNTVKYLAAYAEDAVQKAAGQSKDKVKDFIKNLADKKTAGRFALNIAMYAAVLGFLQVIPKLYNSAEGQSNAGLKGLMQEETFNDKELNAKYAKQPDKADSSKNKANPSFGSMFTPIADKLTDGGRLSRFANNAAEFDGCNLSFPFLLFLMFGGILLPRTLKAKDKYDREEILRRDLISCAVMCFAAKELEKGFSKLNEVKSGLVLASKDKGFKDKSLFKRFFDYLKPITGVRVLSTDQIRAKYTDIDKYKEGVKGFCDFISGQGGQLNKVFSLSEKSKEIVNELLKKEGKDIASADNAAITAAIEKAKGTDALERLASLFRNRNNPWVVKARTLNSKFTALSVLVLVPLFLGFMLPFINERSTKKRIKDELAASKTPGAASNNKNFDFMKEIKNNSVFSEMVKYTK